MGHRAYDEISHRILQVLCHESLFTVYRYMIMKLALDVRIKLQQFFSKKYMRIVF